MPSFRRLLTVGVLAALASGGVALAQAVASPAVQAATFGKIFGFDRSLERGKLRILVLNDQPSGKDAAVSLQQAFTAAGLPAEVSTAAAAKGRLNASTVAYLMPGTVTPQVLEEAAAAHTLTIAGDPALAEQGKVSVGLGMRGDKPDIVVHMERVQAEGHEFAAQLLSFARVIRPGGGTSPAGSVETTQAPALVTLSKPEYPAMARRLQVQGDVVMRLAVDENGKVTGVELVKGIGRGGLDEVAMAAARSARFKPATRNGTAVPGTYLLTMPFRL
jgi:protein TonB